jgi:hypothetical protein
MTGYDEQHLVTYLRLLDTDAEGADFQEVAKIVLHVAQCASQTGQSVRRKAIWPVLTQNGYRHLLCGIAPH